MVRFIKLRREAEPPSAIYRLVPHVRRIAMGRPVDLYDVRRVDAALGATLEKLAAAAAAGATAGVCSYQIQNAMLG